MSSDAAMAILAVFLLVGIGDAGGMKLVSLRNGSLSFDGPNGGFFSILVLSAACVRDGLLEAGAAKALVSCFNLVFRSSAN